MYCAHNMSATILAIHLKDGIFIQIKFMKYDQYCPRILGVKNTNSPDAKNILFHIFLKGDRKATLH